MKGILLLACALQLAFSIECDSKITSLYEQLQRAKLAQKPNQGKINYLQNRIKFIQNACENNQISNAKLKEIEFDAKVIYEKEKLAQEQEKLQESYARLDAKRKKLDEKAKQLQERSKALEDY